MPGFDGTGPRGQGPMTGGARGYCVMPANEAGFGKGIYGGRGAGRGGARGWRNCFCATGLPVRTRGGDELSSLKSREEYLKNELDALQARVRELETK